MRANAAVFKGAVAPRVGAWIETIDFAERPFAHSKSHPVWVRGLKLVVGVVNVLRHMSHPVWVRGLKPA